MNIPWIRLVLAISLDGRLAFPNGGNTSLGGKRDRFFLEKSLAWADGILIGGGTIRAHQNICLINDHQLLEQRKAEGRSAQPVAVVVSSQKDFCNKWPFFKQPIERWLISPREVLSQLSRTSLKDYERQFSMLENWEQTLSQLTKLGLKRLVLLGGADLVGSFLQDDQIDELQLTLTPKIIGGEYNWVPAKIKNLPKQLSNSDAWVLTGSQSIGDNELLLRYLRNHSQDCKSDI